MSEADPKKRQGFPFQWTPEGFWSAPDGDRDKAPCTAD